MELSSFENKSLNYFFERGLNKNIHPNANITLILTTIRNKTKLETHDFAYKDDNKKLVFDITKMFQKAFLYFALMRNLI